jgi:hypothetical protein
MVDIHYFENRPTEELEGIIKACKAQKWDERHFPDLPLVEQELRDRKLNQLLNQ